MHNVDLSLLPIVAVFMAMALGLHRLNVHLKNNDHRPPPSF